MSKELTDLMNDLHQMQILLNFMIKGLAALSTESTEDSLRLTEIQAFQVYEHTRNMVDTMMKRTEEAFKEQFCKPVE